MTNERGAVKKFNATGVTNVICFRFHEKVRLTLLEPKHQSSALFTKMSRKEALSQFIQQIHGRPVVVKLNSGVDYRGVLACIDGYMNIALEQTEEYVNGQLKDKYGDAFIRGNNVLYISTQKRRS